MLLFRNQIVAFSDAAVGENDQVPVAMHIGALDEPGLAGPLMRRSRFVIEAHRDVIEPCILGQNVIGIVQNLLHRRTNPSLAGRSKGGQGINPGVGKISVGRVGGAVLDLRPTAVALHVNICCYIKVRLATHCTRCALARIPV